MADNVRPSVGTNDGPFFVSANFTFSGDSAHAPGGFLGILSGSEGAWTYTLLVGGAGAVTAGVQRMTLASDDPGVAHLATIAGDTTNIETSVQLIDDAIYTDGIGTPSKGMAVMGTDGTNPQIISTNATGHVNIADGGNTITVDGTVAVSGTVTVGSHAVTNAGTFAVQVDGTALTRLTDIETNTDSGAVIGNGAAATAQRVTLASDSTGVVALTTSTASIGKLAANSGVDIGDVDVLTLPNVTLAAGTNTNEVVGDAAHGAAVAGNPLLVGIEGRSSDPTAVDSGDVVRALGTLLGKQVTIPYAIPASTWSYATPTLGVTDTADDEAKAAGAAGVRNYVTSAQIINGHATVATEVVIKDGSTVLWRGWAEAVGGGAAPKFDPPLRGTAATAINVANITTGAKVYFNLQGFQALE